MKRWRSVAASTVLSLSIGTVSTLVFPAAGRSAHAATQPIPADVTTSVYQPTPSHPVRPGHAKPDSPVVYSFAETYDGKTIDLSDVSLHAKLLQQVAAFNATVTKQGLVQGGVPRDLLAIAAKTHIQVQLTVANLGVNGFDQTLLHTLLSNVHQANALAHSIAAAAKPDEISGINLDFENVAPGDRGWFNYFLTQLHRQLLHEGKELVVDIPAETDTPRPMSYDAGYNYRAIGNRADKVVVMAYDYSYPGGSAGAIAPVWWVTNVAKYAVSQIKAPKVLLGIPTYAYEWTGRTTTAYSLTAAMKLSAQVGVQSSWDGRDEAPHYSFTNSAGTHQVYYENIKSLQDKLNIARIVHCGGVAFWRVGLEMPAMWTLLRQYELRR